MFIQSIITDSYNRSYLNQVSTKKVMITPNNVISFNGGSTSAGAPLKRLRNITCPYFGIKMIDNPTILHIQKDLSGCKTIKKTTKYLSKYRDNMLTTEKGIFDRLSDASADFSRKQIPLALNDWYNDALTKLIIEEFTVLDEIDRMSLQLSPQMALQIHEITMKCRETIFANKEDNTFKRKNLITSIDKIIPTKEEATQLDLIKDKTHFLPTSATSENAFIVKYAKRSHDEVAARIINPSAISIEHIIPASMGGKNELKNFLLVSAGANNLRQNTHLAKFIARFPQITKFCQLSIDEIVQIINNGGLKGFETYPYDVRNTLRYASGGLIKINLTKMKYTKPEAAAMVKQAKDKILMYKNKKNKSL